MFDAVRDDAGSQALKGGLKPGCENKEGLRQKQHDLIHAAETDSTHSQNLEHPRLRCSMESRYAIYHGRD